MRRNTDPEHQWKSSFQHKLSEPFKFYMMCNYYLFLKLKMLFNSFWDHILVIYILLDICSNGNIRVLTLFLIAICISFYRLNIVQCSQLFVLVNNTARRAPGHSGLCPDKFLQRNFLQMGQDTSPLLSTKGCSRTHSVTSLTLELKVFWSSKYSLQIVWVF